MEAMGFSHARRSLSQTFDRVCADHEPVIVMRQGKAKQSVVIMSLEDYQSLEETVYLLRSPANAKRLLESVRQLESGEGCIRDLDE